MKLLLIIMIFSIAILNIPLFGSVLVRVEKGSDFTVLIWKHTEGTADNVVPHNETRETLKEIVGILDKHQVTTFIFNEGVFTILKYDDVPSGKKWAALSQAEKDMVYFVQKKFDVTEKK